MTRDLVRALTNALFHAGKGDLVHAGKGDLDIAARWREAGTDFVL